MLKLRIIFFLSLLQAVFLAHGQVLKKNYWFSNDSTKGLEKTVEVLIADTSIFHGQYLHFFQNGNLRISGQFKKNIPLGTWKYYYESGLLKQSINYRNDSVSYWKYFFENGTIKKEGLVKNQLKDSIWTYYYEQGTILKKGEYKKDLQNKQWNYFYEDGENKAIANYEMGTGNYTEYYYKGGVKMRGPVLNNESNGVWTYFYEDGKIKAKGFEQNGVKNGQWIYYYQNDTLASKGTYVNGSKQGEWEFYHPNGNLSSQGLMSTGLRDGYWKLYKEDGGFKADANLLNGTGTYKEYYHNNKVKVNGYLKSDKNHGHWTYYYEDGTLEAEADFEDGFGEYKEYYNSGELKMVGYIKDGKQVGTWELFDKDGTVIGYYKLIPVGEDGAMQKVEIASTDNNPPVLPNDTVSTHKMPHFIIHHPQKFAPFQPKYGESKGFILTMNPLAVVAGQIPVSLEYFIQERLGHELRYTFRRTPFFLPDKSIRDSVLYSRGYSLDFKQKFYSKFKDDRGMLYFGHELRFINDNFYVKTKNSSVLNTLNEKKVEYAWTVGDRVLGDIRLGGLTFDIYVGLGVAYVYKKWNVADDIRYKYISLSKNIIELNPRVGFSLGYLF